jgi:hypothetical protein
MNRAPIGWQTRWAAWALVFLLGLSLFFVGHEPWQKRLLEVVLFQLLMGGWFLLLRYVQMKATDPTSEGKNFRGQMPVWRTALWIVVASAGVFWFGSDHSWRMAFLATAFCGIFVGGFSFLLNWARGERGKTWSRKHVQTVVAVYALAQGACVMLKLTETVFRPK